MSTPRDPGTDESGEESTSIVVTKFSRFYDSEFTPPAEVETTPSISIPDITIPTSISIPGGGTITISSIPFGSVTPVSNPGQ